MADIDCTTVPIPDFHDIIFSPYISLGARVSVRYQTQVIRMRSGREERIGEWQDALRDFDITPALRDQADLDSVLAFFEARSGPKYGFKLLDPTDNNVINQHVGTGNGEQTQFALSKFYTTTLEGETHTTIRPIVCPDANIEVYVNSILQTSGYAINTTMGLITFTTPPASGANIAWSGSFYVPVRFVETRMAVSVEAYQSYDWRIRIMEIRTPISLCTPQETLNEDFVEVQLPLAFSRESTFGPEFATIVINSDSGQTNRVSQFVEGLQRFKIENPVKPISIMNDLLHFFHARRGKLIGFRFQDYLTNSVVAEPFAIANGNLTKFQLIRTFYSGSVGRVKTIYKPIEPIIVLINSVEDPTVTVNYTTGIVTFASPPSASAVLSWTGSYDIPVRFDTDVITMQLNGIDAMGWDSIELVEYNLEGDPLIGIPGVSQWNWIQEWLEVFTYTTTWATTATYNEEWESVVWDSGSGSLPWSVFAGAGAAVFGNAGTLLTAGMIAGVASLQVRMPRTGSTSVSNYYVQVRDKSFATTPPPRIGASGRYRTLWRADAPPILIVPPAVHWWGFFWLGDDSPASAFGFMLELDVDTGHTLLWRYGVFSGSWLRPQFVTYTSGELDIAPGTICALEVEWFSDRFNAKDLRQWVRFAPQSDFTALPTLATQHWHEGDETLLVPLPPQVNTECLYGLPAAEGVGMVSVDSTALRQDTDSSQSVNYTQSWSTIWRSPTTGTQLLMSSINNLTPLSGTGSLRVRRRRTGIAPIAAKHDALGFQHDNRAGGTGLLNGRLQMSWRMDVSAGTEFNYVGGLCLASSTSYGTASTSWYGILYECDQASAAWTRLLCVFIPNGVYQAFTILQSVNLPAAINGHIVTMRMEWHLDAVEDTVQFIGSMGTALDGSNLATVLTYTGPRSVSQTLSFGEGPVVIFECDGTVVSDVDVTMDSCSLSSGTML